MSLQKPGPPLDRKSAWRTLGVVLLLIAIAVGAPFAWKKYKARPLSVAETKQLIRDYLEEKAGVSRFDPSKVEEVAANAAGPDDQAANSGKPEAKKKKKPRPPQEQLVRDFRRSIKESADYQTTYRLIGENLARVDTLLAAPDPERTEAALLLAVGASRAALDPAVDGWLAARIAEAYLWPNLDHAPDKGDVDAASLLDISEDAFKAADETDNLVRNYRLLIARGNHPGKADKYRVRLAKLLEGQENFTEALRVLRQVRDTNNPSYVRRIAAVEQMLRHEKATN